MRYSAKGWGEDGVVLLNVGLAVGHSSVSVLYCQVTQATRMGRERRGINHSEAGQTLIEKTELGLYICFRLNYYCRRVVRRIAVFYLFVIRTRYAGMC